MRSILQHSTNFNYKGILLDLDNTLYHYQEAHGPALERVFHFLETQFQMQQPRLQDAFDLARKKVHTDLKNTGASHNRLLYFQLMLENLNLHAPSMALKLYHLYWDHFLEKMELFPGVGDFFQKAKAKKVKVCLVTDLTAHIQYRKIEKLRISPYLDFLVTSEEAGIEKPASRMFELALAKLGLSPHEVCMIGDSYEKDMRGAQSLGIDGFWLDHENKDQHPSPFPAQKNQDKITRLSSFSELNDLLFGDSL